MSQEQQLCFADTLGQVHVVRVTSSDGDWHLQTEINGRVFSKRCSDWQRVERALNWLRRHAHEPQLVDAAA